MPGTSPDELRGIPFTKMTGSGNDFIVFDARSVDGALVTKPEVIRAMCNRYNGIGADGVVLLEPAPVGADVRIRYYNSDGSAADLCGNATLCSSAMSVQLGLGTAEALTLLTDAGLIHSRLYGETPEIDLGPVTEIVDDCAITLEAGERRIGYALAGVPHLVVLCDDVETVDVANRGAFLRDHATLSTSGANVNFVSSTANGRWRYRTFERGVEGETMACGTGSVGVGILLVRWGQTTSPVHLVTSSGRQAKVSLRRSEAASGSFWPSLKGEGRIVFRGITEVISGTV